MWCTCGHECNWEDAHFEVKNGYKLSRCPMCQDFMEQSQLPPSALQQQMIQQPAPATMGTSTNPKDRIGRTKPPIELIPPSAILYETQAVGGNGRIATISAVGLIHEAMAFKNGAVKYNPYNWRSEKVSAMIYMGAAWRHMLDLTDRQDYASDSGVHHAAHAKACLGIFIDAYVTGNLVDDRPAEGKAAQIVAYDYEVLPMRTTGNHVSAIKLISCVMNDICIIIDRGDEALAIAGRARATLGCYLDAMENGYLDDDRPKTGKAAEVIERFTEKKDIVIGPGCS